MTKFVDPNQSTDYLNVLKILHINDFRRGGGAENIFLTSHQLTGEIFESQLYTPEESFEQGRLPNLFRFFWRDQVLSNLLASFQPDIVHVHNFHNRIGVSLFLAIRGVRGKKPKVVFTAHDFFLLWPNPSYCHFNRGQFIKFETPPTWSDFFRKSASRESFLISILRKLSWLYVIWVVRVVNDIDIIITPSDFLNGLISKKFQKPVITIRNPIELKCRSESIGNPSGVVRAIFLGRLSPEKGLVEFLEKIAKIRDHQFEMDIFGDGECKEELRHIIVKYNLSETVRLMGYVSAQEKNEIIGKYDVLVLPSVWHENAPLTIIEGAMAGLRLLVSGFGGMKELAELAGGHYLFDPNNFFSVKQALTACVEDRLMGKTVDRNVEELHSIFSYAFYCKEITKAYRSIL